MAARTRAASLSSTEATPLTVRETVATETPASRATSRMSARLPLPSARFARAIVSLLFDQGCPDMS